MEERVNKTRRLIRRQQQLQDVPELIHQIQSLLPPDQAARTCVLSKSWQYAFSTSPTLRLQQPVKSFLNKQQQQERRRYARFISRTLRRYHRDNLPIITCHLHFAIHKHKSASRAENWIKKLLTSKTCLKELCLTILPAIASYTLPDVLFSSEKLDKLSLQLDSQSKIYSLHISSNPVINCVNLRVLELLDVHITQDGLHNLLSSCKLLEKINLKLPNRLKKIKFDPHIEWLPYGNLGYQMCFVEEIDDTSEARANKEQFELHMMLVDAIDDMFFLKMRAALNLSSKFKIELECYGFMVPFDIDDVRRRITFPATNVEKLLLVEYSPENSLDKSLLIDVLFSICRPNQVEVSYDFAHNVANYFSVVEKKTGNVYWPHVEIRDPEDGQWETLSTSTISLLDELFHCAHLNPVIDILVSE
ncbi:acyl carrier protein 1, chloroplastic-like protein [Tanacetum coccineum]|uniref:Acyl carrier protein 1, chloroplastic-like protein n=1 Tax=Tanacetum coccineum TaxID=301880 RepID=A0ABQ5DH86_9ASTR